MTEQNTNSFISDVQREYDKIDRQWMLLHYRTIIGTILLSMAVELSLGFFFFGMEKSIAISFELYVQKFILRPLLYNIVWLGITIAARHVRGISVRARAYVFSIALVEKMTVDQAIRILAQHRESVRLGQARGRRSSARHVATQEETDAALIKRIRIAERHRIARGQPSLLSDGRSPGGGAEPGDA